jgi:hypothetical protein
MPTLPIRPSAEELTHLHERAKAAGQSLNRYLIECGLAMDGHAPDPRGRELWERAVFEVRKVSYALKQIAVRLERQPVAGEKIETAIAETREAITAIATALGSGEG